MLHRTLLLVLVVIKLTDQIHSVDKRALQKSHEKPQSEKWMDSFFGTNLKFDRTASLVALLNMIIENHLSGCVPVILYHSAVEENEELLLQQLFKNNAIPIMHGQITPKYYVRTKGMLNSLDKCVSYIMFMEDVMRCKDIIGAQNSNKVVVIARSSQWRVHEFLASEVSQSFVNLLVIVQSEKVVAMGEELPFILYTHEMYVDGIGSSSPRVIASWKNGRLSVPNVRLFPEKMKDGFSGHRFIFSVSNQPPFAIKRYKERLSGRMRSTLK